LLIWACDRIARSTRHFLEVLDELNRLNIEFVSFRESIDTGGPLGRAIVVIIGAIAEPERSLIVERVRSGMRRAKLEGRHIGRPALELDREAICKDRQHGWSLGKIAKVHRISRTTVHRVLNQHASASQESVA
jgi:DNA invertase Pin-like site-specific DNA recombinase